MKSFTFPHGLAYAFSALGTLLPVLQAVAPAAVPGPTGIAIAAGIGGLLTLGHQVYSAYQSGQAPATASPSVPPVVKMLPVLLAAVLVAGMLGTLTACKTAPTPAQQAGINVAVDVAAGFAIQQHDTDPAKWRARATEYKAIAVELKAVNDAGAASLATLAADLAPLVAKLPPADQLAAQALEAALVPYLQDQIRANPSLGATQAAVDGILQAVIDACGAYGA